MTLGERRPDGAVVIREHGEELVLRPSFSQAHNLRNLLAAVAAARALGYTPEGEVRVEFSEMRGQRHALAGGGLLIEDCYNANPMSMRAALEDLAASAAGRRVAVLGEMLELGEQGPALHRGSAVRPARPGVELLVAVGPLGAEIAATFPGEAHTVAGRRRGRAAAAGAAGRGRHRAGEGLARRRARGRLLGATGGSRRA